MIYRASAGERAGSGEALSLDGAALDGDYLRITWHAASRLVSPVVVRGVVLLTRPAAVDRESGVDAVPPPLADAHAGEFALPFATPVAVIRIGLRGEDIVLPVRVLGRDDREQPWTLLGQGIASRARGDAAGDRGIALEGGTFRTMRIEAAPQTPGFTAAPAIRFEFAPRDIVFLAAGTPPYALAAGRAGAPDAYLPLADLVGQATGAPLLATAKSAPTAPLALAPAGDAGGNKRQAVLWAILLAATALLGGMAWALWKRAPATNPDEPAG